MGDRMGLEEVITKEADGRLPGGEGINRSMCGYLFFFLQNAEL